MCVLCERVRPPLAYTYSRSLDQQTYECILNVVFRRYEKLQGIVVPHVSYLAIYVLNISM